MNKVVGFVVLFAALHRKYNIEIKFKINKFRKRY